jgi:hypothetical protein
MPGEAVAGFEAMGFSADDAWLLDTVGLIPADLKGWRKRDAVTLAGAVNHQGLDPLMAEYLFTTHKGDLGAAWEDMAEDSEE